MRTSNTLDALLPRTRQAILATILLQPMRAWYLSDLARHLRLTPSSLQRELAALVKAGILRHYRDGNRVYYQADPDCPVLPELQGLLTKTAGLADVLLRCLQPYAARIQLALIYGSVARSQERSASDVDLLVVGAVGLLDLAPALREAETQLLRPVNPLVYSAQEFAEKAESGHHVLKSILGNDMILLIGSEDELKRLTQRESHPPAHHE